MQDASERLGLLQQVAGIGTWDYEVATRTMRWSPEVYALYGVPADQPPPFGDSWMALIHPDDRDTVRAAHAKALGGGETYRVDFRVGTDGNWRWIAARARIQRGANGEPTHVNGVNMDVTEQREAARAQERSAARFEALVNSVAQVVWVIDGAGQITEDSPSWRAFTGQSFDEMAGLGWVEAIHPDDRDHMAAEWRRQTKARASFQIEYRLKRHEDGWRTMLVRGTPILGDDGRVATWVGFSIDVTAEREAAAALRTRDAEYRALADNLPNLCWMATADGSIYWYNRRWYDYTGTTFEQMQGWGWRDVHDPAVLPEVMRRWQASIDSGEPFEMTFPLRAADGTFRPFLTRIVPVRDDDGVIRWWFGNNVDVSETVAQNNRLRLAQEAGGIGLWDIDIATGDVWWSDRIYSLLGYRSDDTEPRAELFMDKIHSEDRPAVDAAMTAMLEQGTPLDAEFRICRTDGEERWLVGRGEMVRDSKGNPERFIGVNYDVTDRRRAEIARAESEARLRAVVDAAPIGLVFADPTGRITGGNARVEQIIGHPVLPSPNVDAYGEWISYHPDGRQVAAREYPLGRALAGEDLPELEVHYQRGDGRRTWIRFIASATRDAEGRITGGVVASLDIDRERRAEADLRQLNADLAAAVERAVSERAEALAQLHEAQKLETLGQLTGGVAHDFNNLLTPIVGSLDLLRRRLPLEARDLRLVDGALAAADRAKTLVQRLLAFGRRQLLQATAVDLAALVAGVDDLIRRSVGPDIDLVVDVPQRLPPAHIDANQLELALLNMALNARDAMPEGGRLTVTAIEASAPSGLKKGRYLCLTVADTGTGMDAETLRRATEPFFTTKGVGRGTGLGLSMAHGLAGQSGGRLDIASTPGEGTTVTVWLPVSENVPATPDDGEGSDGPAGQGTVLLVDDEELVRANTAAMLVDLGYRVEEAGSAAEALAALDGGLVPDLIVTDWAMPKMNGGRLLAEVRRRLPAVPGLVLTGYVAPEGIGVDAPIIAKPFKQEELAAQVAALLTPAR